MENGGFPVRQGISGVVTTGENPVLLLQKIGQLLAPLTAVGWGSKNNDNQRFAFREKAQVH
jgi:hypothetical protein